MGKQLERLTPRLETFINSQKMFFVGTAMTEGRINLSPKGMDTLRVVSPNKVIWLNLTGSGNETATHLLESDRMTIMFCAFDGKPLILRLYGKAKVFHPRDVEFNNYLKLFPKILGSRQIIEMNVELVQTSCGFAVPLMQFEGERALLSAWSSKKGQEGIESYWQEKNSISLDGHPTKI
jgi:hypothetical protein